ncbi:MAG TPA: hypothetical protein VET65_01600 [Candidatus Limnocylindrales bacterium]|nr:hypothetical protein [Candidatus Limnocylindrales bacterium]
MLAVALFWSSWQDPGRLTPGGGGDIAYTIWFLRWVAFAITHGHNPLLTTYLDYPAGVNLMWSGLFLLPAVLLTPVTLTLGPVVAHTLFATLAVAGSAFTGYLAIRRYVRHEWGALLGGALYGFSPAMIAQSLGHLQIAVAIIPPLMLIALDEILVRQRRSWVVAGAGLGALGAAQLWTGEELVACEALVAIIGIALLAGLHPEAVRLKAPHALRAFAVAAPLALLLSAYPLAVQFLGPQRVSGTLQPLNIYASDLLNFILPTRVQALAPPALVQITDRFSGNLSEWNAYLGIALIAILVMAAVSRWREPVIRLSALMGVLIAILSLGVTLHVGGAMTALPVPLLGVVFPQVRHGVPGRTMLFTLAGSWAALSLLPVVHDILPNRLMLFVFLFAGILLAAFVESVARAAAPRTRRLGALAIGLALLPLLPSLPFPTMDARSPRYFEADAASGLPAGAVALIAPYSRGGYADAMLWQAASGMAFRMPEGYAFVPGPSPNPPPTAIGIRMVEIEQRGGSALTPAERETMLQDLHAWQVRTVIIGPMAHRADMVAFFRTLLAQEPVQQDGVVVFAGVRG